MDELEKKHYKRFRTGLDYREVAAMVWSYNEDSTTWLKGSDGPKGRRRLVLGKWSEIKKEMWEHVLNECGGLDGYIRSLKEDLEPIPF